MRVSRQDVWRVKLSAPMNYVASMPENRIVKKWKTILNSSRYHLMVGPHFCRYLIICKALLMLSPSPCPHLLSAQVCPGGLPPPNTLVLIQDQANKKSGLLIHWPNHLVDWISPPLRLWNIWQSILFCLILAKLRCPGSLGGKVSTTPALHSVHSGLPDIAFYFAWSWLSAGVL